jgi:hypothetical protein
MEDHLQRVVERLRVKTARLRRHYRLLAIRQSLRIAAAVATIITAIRILAAGVIAGLLGSFSIGPGIRFK